MEGNTLPLDEFLERHPEVTWPPCSVNGVWHATVRLDGATGDMHGHTEGELLEKLTAALGGQP